MPITAADIYALAPYAKTLGVAFGRLEAELVEARLGHAVALSTGGGAMHGGALMGLADVAAASARRSTAGRAPCRSRRPWSPARTSSARCSAPGRSRRHAPARRQIDRDGRRGHPRRPGPSVHTRHPARRAQEALMTGSGDSGPLAHGAVHGPGAAREAGCTRRFSTPRRPCSTRRGRVPSPSAPWRSGWASATPPCISTSPTARPC